MKVRELVRTIMREVLSFIPPGVGQGYASAQAWIQVEGILTELPNFFCKVLEVDGRPWIVTPPGKDGKSWMFPANLHGQGDIRDRPVKRQLSKAEYAALPMRALAFVELART